jgi:hypothetical protein
LAQTGLSGRYPTLGDIVFNTVGGGAGALLAHFARKLPGVLPTPPKRLALVSALLPVAVFLGTAFLVQPTYPETEYYGQWKHELGHLVPYPGDVLSARVGDHFLPDDLLQSTGPVKAALEAGEPIHFSLSTAEISPNPAHVLAIYDDTQTEVFMVMDWEGELRFRRRTRSVALRLDQPHFSWPGALLRGRGETVDAAIRQEARALCLELDGRLLCDGAGGVEEGWRLLHQLHASDSPLAHVSSAVWLLLLCFPAGFFGRGRPRAIGLLGASLSAVAVLVSWWSPALGLRALTFLGPVSAVVLGHACARILAAKGILTGERGSG